MTAQELYQLGEAAYGADNYSEALKYYSEAAAEISDAAATIPFCYVNIASQISQDASNHAKDTAYLVKGQQRAVSCLDLAIRSALQVHKNYPDQFLACTMATSAICNAINMQYALVSTGLTTAYRISGKESTIRKTILETKLGEEVISKEVLWEDIIEEKEYDHISLNSYDLHDYHVVGPDEKTKRIRASLNTIMTNAYQLADILTCVGKEYDAYMVRAITACSIAESDGGDRGMILSAEVFLNMAKELLPLSLTVDETTTWMQLHDLTFSTYHDLADKYAALLKRLRRNNQASNIAKFFSDPADAPVEEVPVADTAADAKPAAPKKNNKGSFGEWFEVFLTTFAQITFMKVFPSILFASIISLFCGGLFHVFSANADSFTQIFGIIWFIVTMVLTLLRAVANGDEFRKAGTYKIFFFTMLGTALLFSIHFVVALALFIVAWCLAKKYK